MVTENTFTPFFQKEICIVIDNKVLRQGKLLLFAIKDFYLHFTIVSNNVTKTYELPYPFDAYVMGVSSKSIVLDYKTKTFTKDLPEIFDKAKMLFNKDKHMKFFDSIVKIVETP